MNLMKTFKYGGRKTPPSKEELNQLVVSMKIKIYTARCTLYFDLREEEDFEGKTTGKPLSQCVIAKV